MVLRPRGARPSSERADLHGRRVVDIALKTELAVPTGSPYPESAVGFEPDRVAVARRYGRPCGERAPLHGRRTANNIPRAELAFIVLPPRPQGTVGFDSERLSIPSDLRPGNEASQLHG